MRFEVPSVEPSSVTIISILPVNICFSTDLIRLPITFLPLRLGTMTEIFGWVILQLSSKSNGSLGQLERYQSGRMRRILDHFNNSRNICQSPEEIGLDEKC